MISLFFFFTSKNTLVMIPLYKYIKEGKRMRGSGRKRHLRGREKGGVRRMGKREEGRGKGWGVGRRTL